MESGTFVSGLVELAQDFEVLFEAAERFLDSRIYHQRLRRCLVNADNMKALQDFLELDDLLLATLGILGSKRDEYLRETREGCFRAILETVVEEGAIESRCLPYVRRLKSRLLQRTGIGESWHSIVEELAREQAEV